MKVLAILATSSFVQFIGPMGDPCVEFRGLMSLVRAWLAVATAIRFGSRELQNSTLRSSRLFASHTGLFGRHGFPLAWQRDGIRPIAPRRHQQLPRSTM